MKDDFYEEMDPELFNEGYEDMDCMVDSDNTCIEDYHDPAENNMMLSKNVDTEYQSKPDEELSTVNPLWSDFRFDDVNTLELLMMVNPAYDPPLFTSPARLLSDDAHDKLEDPSLGSDDQSESYVNDDEDPTNQKDDQSESYVNDDEDPTNQTDAYDQSKSYVNDDEDPTNQTLSDDQSESYVNDDEDPTNQTDDQSEYVNDDEDPAES